ncbi:MAG TPA: hypothetical protein VGU25_07535 [Acidobacteriaceae bacterium]|nr:hypothetical protein [Acidobacteriaceae bacterium]
MSLSLVAVLGFFASAHLAPAQTYSSSDTTQISSAALPDAPSAIQAQEQQQQQQQPTSQQPQQQPPAQNPAAPSLSDLGLSPAQTAPDPALQARLDRHTQMLKIHQKLGLLTLIPMAAAVISSGGATAGHNGAPGTTTTGGGPTTSRDLHAALGGLTVAMYGTTAYFAIAAPKIPEGHVKGGIKVHKYLVWIHGPGMVLTPILGAMAFNQLNNGEKVHGIASAHAAVAWTTVISYSAAIVAVSWPIKL